MGQKSRFTQNGTAHPIKQQSNLSLGKGEERQVSTLIIRIDCSNIIPPPRIGSIFIRIFGSVDLILAQIPTTNHQYVGNIPNVSRDLGRDRRNIRGAISSTADLSASLTDAIAIAFEEELGA